MEATASYHTMRPYSAPISELLCNLGTVTYGCIDLALIDKQSPFAQMSSLVGCVGVGMITGLGSLVYSGKELFRHIEQLSYGSIESPQTWLLLLKIQGLFHWAVNGLASLAAVLCTLVDKAKQVLQPLASFGPIAGIAAAGTFALLDIERLCELFMQKTTNWSEIQERCRSLLANICMIIAPVILLTLALSQPQVVIAISVLFGLIAAACHVMNNWDWFMEHPLKGLLCLLLIVAGCFTIFI